MKSAIFDDDDIFLGMTTVDDFDTRLSQLCHQQNLQRSQSMMQASQATIKKQYSMNNSQMSTALNSTIGNPKPVEIRSPTRRIAISYTETQHLDRFIEKVHVVTTKCMEQTDHARGECIRICDDLGVSVYKLQQLPNVQLREDYIMSQIHKQVIEQLKMWSMKIESREAQKQKIQHSTQSDEQQMLQIFNWVGIHSKFRKLKKQLKFALVQIINDNQQMISKQIKQSNQITNIKYTKPDTRAIIDELTNLLKTIKTKGQQNNKPLEHSIMQQPQCVSDVWNPQKEGKFIQRRQSAKARLSKMINSSSWNVVGMGEFVSTFDKTQQNKIEKDKIMTKFNENEPITDSELLYLVNTSVLLNKCADKKFLQFAINKLDKDIISDVELQIAENILKGYNNVKELLSKQRFQWLQIKNDKQLRLNKQNNNTTITPQRQQNEIRQYHKKIIAKILLMIRDMKSTNKQTVKQDSNRYQIYYAQYKSGNPIANPLVWKFKDILMKLLNQRKLDKRNQQLNVKSHDVKQIFPSKDKDLTLSNVRRLLHPSSKVYLQPTNDLIKVRPHDKEQQDYCLRLSKKAYEQIPSNFQLFYSGGPIRDRPYANKSLQIVPIEESTLPYKGGWITSEIEITAINKIKKALKAYMARKRYRQIKQIRKQQFIEQEELKNKSLFNAIQKLRAKPRLDIDIEECYKKLQVALNQKEVIKVKVAAPKIDYSKVFIPKKMIQLKLKQRKLFLALKVGNQAWTEHSGFVFDATDVNCYDIDMYSPLYHAAKLQSIPFCVFLLNAGADVNQPCLDGETPVFAAFRTNNMLIINLFLQHGADLDRVDNKHKNPLCYCSIELLRELNLATVTVQQGGQPSKINEIINRRSQSMIDLGAPAYADMHFIPLYDSKEEVAWCNQQEATLKSFYPKDVREAFLEQKHKLMIIRQSKKSGKRQ